ncbi:MAG: DNA repair protein RecN [Spirochaetales bacterium]|nr:DNA repair protein RecN [Spirochaetales bacterium]
MLDKLIVKNYALIKNIEVDFSKKFNILTGETGAGKSILVGALGLLLGSKAEADVISTGEEVAEVSGIIDISFSPEANSWLEDRDIEADDGKILVRRVLKRNSRGGAYIQSTPVTVGDLAEFSSLVFDMHSQHQNQSLLRADSHRRLLDRFAGIEDDVAQLSALFTKLGNLKREYDQLIAKESEREREIDFLTFAIDEISLLKLKLGEDDEIESELKVISQHEKIAEKMDLFLQNVGNQTGLLQLNEGVKSLEFLAGIDPDYADLLSRFQNVYYEVEDIVNTVVSNQDSFDFSPQRLESLQQRISDINRMKKKYGGSIEAVLQYLDDSQIKVEKLRKFDSEKAGYEKSMADCEAQLRKLAIKVSDSRKQAASRLSEAITTQLRPLGMKNAIFSILVEVRALDNGKPACGPTGIDLVRFMFSANKGEPLKRINDIASGGELSRVMLAIKSVFAEIDPIHTLVFDEIDSGIGGEVAKSVALHMKKLASFKQILCISHLASIAAFADTHIKIDKKVVDNSTVTDVFELDEKSRISEVARMLSGNDDEVSILHAKQLIQTST